MADKSHKGRDREPGEGKKIGQWREWVTEEGLLLIEGWARDGLLDADIADNIGIAKCTLYDWRNKYPEIKEALRQGKEVADRKVENALHKRALGFDYTEVKVTRKLTDDLEVVEEITRTKKHVPGDVTAQIFWLKKRKRQEWGGDDHYGSSDKGVEDLTPLAELLGVKK